MASSQWRKQLVVIACMALVATGRSQDPPHRNFTVADGLPSNTVYWVMQDRDGYLWFGTDAGASRFDGLHFENWTTSDGLADNEVLSIHQDSKARIWFFSLNGKLSFYLNGAISDASAHPEFVELVGEGGSLSFAEEADGTLWFSDFRGHVRYLKSDGRTGRVDLIDPVTGQTGGNTIIMVDRTEGLVATAGTGIHAIKAGGTRYICALHCADVPVGITDQAGNALFLSREGLVRFHGHELGIITPAELIPGRAECQTIAHSRSGDLWLNRNTAGAQRLVWQHNSFVNDRVYFSGHIVSCVFEDAEGNIWFSTTDAGVILVTASQMRMHLFPSSLTAANTSTMCLHLDDHGVLWSGNSIGEVYRCSNDRITMAIPRNEPRVAKDLVRSIVHDPKGGIWIARESRTLFLADGAASSSVRDIPALDARVVDGYRTSATMKRLAADRITGEMAGAYFGIARLVDTLGGPTFVFPDASWQMNHRIYAPYFDSTGGLWFETDQQLWRLKHTVLDGFPALSEEFQVRIQDIISLDASTLVIATAGSGVKLVREGRIIARFTMATGMPSDQCRKLCVADGRILVATDRGAAMITDPLGKPSIAVWDHGAGLPSDDVQDVASDGVSIFVGSAAGLCVVPIHAVLRVPFTPSVRFLAITADGSRYGDLSQPIHLTPGTRQVSITAQALAFSDADGPDYQYRLDDGVDWSDSRSGMITLEEPAAGDRLLRVRARALSGAWSAPAELRFTVGQAWVHTIWARIGFMAFITGLGVVIVQYLTRRKMRGKLIELEQERALQEERGRIASDVHDDLGADLSQLLMLARHSMASPTLVEDDRRNLREIETHSSTMVQKIDEIIWNLDPADDTLKATLTFIQRHAEEFAAQHAMEFRTRPIADVADHVFPARERRELHLLVKEILNNIAKHTNASFLRVEAELHLEHVLISIEDNGTARPNATGRNGHGLESMRARIERLNGTIEREALQPFGTRIKIAFAVPRSPSN